MKLRWQLLVEGITDCIIDDELVATIYQEDDGYTAWVYNGDNPQDADKISTIEEAKDWCVAQLVAQRMNRGD